MELEKQISLEIQKMQKQNQYLQKEIPVLPQKINISFEHCKLQPDDICGPCLCSDDNKLLTKHYCNCQNSQPKRNCLQHKQVEIKVNELYKIHQNIRQTVKVFFQRDQSTDCGGCTVFQRRTDGSINFFCDWEQYKQGFGNL